MVQKVPVTRQAVIQRTNRKLRKDGQALKKNRSAATVRGKKDLGDYYIVDLDRNFVVDLDVDVEEIAREIGTLKEYERMKD